MYLGIHLKKNNQEKNTEKKKRKKRTKKERNEQGSNPARSARSDCSVLVITLR